MVGRRAPAARLASGYVQRADADLPQQGDAAPWRVRQNYLLDLLTMRTGRVDDGRLELTRAVRSRTTTR